MAMGKGGPNYWWTEGDARRACEKALAGVTFLVTVPPTHQFRLIPGQRTVAGQWISDDSDFAGNLIAHITMSIDKLTLSPIPAERAAKAKKKSKDADTEVLYHATLEVSGLHYTVRKKVDSTWIDQNIDTVVRDMEVKPTTPEVQRYKQIQAESLHMGLLNDTWNSGNKSNSEAAKNALGITARTRMPADLDKVKGLIASVGATSLKGKSFTYTSAGAKKSNTEKVLTAHTVIITVT